MGIELLTYTIEVLFCGCGCECTAILRKSGKEVAALGPMPVDFAFCMNHADAMLVLRDVPEDEQIGLKVQLESAFKARAEFLRKQIVAPSPLATAVISATPAILESCRKCTVRY